MANPLSGLLARTSGALAVLFGLSMVSNILMLTGSIFMLQVYDRVIPSRSVPTLIALSLLATALYGFYALVEWIRSRMAVRYGGLVDEALSAPLFRAGIRQKVAPVQGGTADPTRDLDTLRLFVSGSGPISLLDLPWIPVYLALIFIFHPLLGWLATGGAVVITGLLVVNEWTTRRPSQEANIATIRRQALADDARSNAESIVAMGMLDAVARRFDGAATELVETQQRQADKAGFYSSVTKAFRYLLQSAVLGVGAYLVIMGQMSGGLMIAASIVTSRALAPVEQVVAQWRGFVAARQAMARIATTLRVTEVAPRATELPLPSRTLVVNHLATGPSRDRRPVVGNINLQLKAGEGLGILGLSGSGKSSVARALVGIWPVLQGEIRLDGSELGHFDQDRLGRAFGYLPQTVELFDGTIAENIARFRPDATTEQVLAAAHAAHVHPLIASMPNGYDTRIGERGAVLSAGQRQRIGLARALFGDPFLIVLDEPNSNLDAEGDNALTDALVNAKARGAIVVVVAHRPSAIAAADKLLFLQNGRQQAFGPKEEVLRQITQQPTLVPGNRGGQRSNG